MTTVKDIVAKWDELWSSPAGMDDYWFLQKFEPYMESIKKEINDGEIKDKSIEKLKNIAIENRATIDVYDYGYSIKATKGNKFVWIRYQFRKERDGYEGYKVVDEEEFKKWLEGL